MLTYDSKFIYEFAERLYKQANGIIVTYTTVGVLLGGVGGYLFGATLGSGGLGALVGAGVLGAIGYSTGVQKAFGLKLQAQIALCQVKIEENTRPKGA